MKNAFRSIGKRPSVGFMLLAVELGANGELPKEFRLFVAGWNDTENGKFLFDADAAAAVMAHAQAWGVDTMIDLEHQSLDSEPQPDPTARDARGWCELELRDDGSLWAVNVTWTPDGAQRLEQKRQRYVSPAFGFDSETRRVTNLVNVAITALPATHNTPALVAAAARRLPRDIRKLSVGPSFAEISTAISAALSSRYPRAEGDYCRGPWIVDVFDASVVYELDGALFEAAYTFDGATVTLAAQAVEVTRSYSPAIAVSAPPAPAPAPAAARTEAEKSMKKASTKALLAAIEALSKGDLTAARAAIGDPAKLQLDPGLTAKAMDAIEKGDGKAALEILKGLVVAAAGGDAEDAPPPAGDGGADETQEPDGAAAAAVPAAGAGDGDTAAPADDKKKKTDDMAAAARLAMSITGKSTPGAAIAELERRSKIAVDVEARQAQLSADQAALEANERRSLVAQLVKLHVELPATAWADEKGTVPCDRLMKEPIAELRARVAKLSAAPQQHRTVTPPASEVGVHGLTQRELALCAEKKIDPAKYAETRAAIRDRSTNARGA